MHGRWEKQTGKYQMGENYRVGKVIVGTASYESGSRGDPAKYKCHCLLPGIRQADSKYTNLEDAKARLERMVGAWFSWL